ncbi:MAG: hypothetical protein US69_C0002G0098 [candidate division TM6 bacterium GW2011_GWF2_38_10]|nr:MAG: hypothetical protein US69_C0002G0098 [candidate division TM6 bacterium GW2011_GWF2_38_10]
MNVKKESILFGAGPSSFLRRNFVGQSSLQNLIVFFAFEHHYNGASQTKLRSSEDWRPQGDSNPCYQNENLVS